MIGTLDPLRLEHEIILAVVERMERAVSEPQSDGTGPFLLACVEFLRRFADENHHGKEERALFPAMRENSRLADLAEVLLEEHGEGRRLYAEIEKAIAGRSAAAITLAVLDYADHIRAHIRKEDEMIFVSVEHALGAAECARLAREFAGVEAETLGPGGTGALLAALDEAQPPQ